MNFQLEGDYVELCDLLKLLGLTSTGGHAKMVIAEGEVTVNGQVELRKRYKVRVGDEVSFSSQRIRIVKK